MRYHLRGVYNPAASTDPYVYKSYGAHSAPPGVYGNLVSNSEFYNIGLKNFTIYGRIMLLNQLSTSGSEYSDWFTKIGPSDHSAATGYSLGFYQGRMFFMLRESGAPGEPDLRLLIRPFEAIDFSADWLNITAVRSGPETLAGVADLTNYKLYVNGVEASGYSYDNSGVTNFNLDNTGVLSAPPEINATYTLNNYISRVGLWNRALSPAEIQSLGSVIPPAGCKLFENFQGASAAGKVRDLSSVRNDSQLTRPVENVNGSGQTSFVRESGIVPVIYGGINTMGEIEWTVPRDLIVRHVGTYYGGINRVDYSTDGGANYQVLNLTDEGGYNAVAYVIKNVNLQLLAGTVLKLRYYCTSPNVWSDHCTIEMFY